MKEVMPNERRKNIPRFDQPGAASVNTLTDYDREIHI